MFINPSFEMSGRLSYMASFIEAVAFVYYITFNSDFNIGFETNITFGIPLFYVEFDKTFFSVSNTINLLCIIISKLLGTS